MTPAIIARIIRDAMKQGATVEISEEKVILRPPHAETAAPVREIDMRSLEVE